MNAETLRNSILQLATCGKLVEQREEEGTAEELYQQILIEKEQLLIEGKIKKSKTLPPIKHEEIPFEVPSSWKWVRIGNLFQHNTGKALNKSNIEGESLTYITTSNLNWGKFDLDKLRTMRFKANELDKCTVKKGDLLVAEGGDFGRAAVWSYDYDIRIQNHIHRLRSFLELDIKYFFYVFYLYKHVGWLKSKGITIKSISSNTLANIVIPLPPLLEQNRIVEKIEELVPLVEEYGEANSRLESLNSKFPDEIKQSILHYAIQGKLLEQREQEGTAEDLYQQVLKEKEQLVKEGKIKKNKPLPAIQPEEIPFEIPSSWKWVRLDDIGSWKSGQTPFRDDSSYYKGDIPWLKTGDLNNDIIFEVSENITAKAVSDYNLRINPKNTVLIAMYGATIGKVGLLEIEACTNQACCACITHENVFPKFLFYYLLHRQQYYSSLGAGGAQPNISREKIVNSVFPLPPLYEQKRIIEKIEEFMQLVNELKGEVS
jgi:type I restriction enzyme S subunit